MKTKLVLAAVSLSFIMFTQGLIQISSFIRLLAEGYSPTEMPLTLLFFGLTAASYVFIALYLWASWRKLDSRQKAIRWLISRISGPIPFSQDEATDQELQEAKRP